jgi:alanine dehydrogenase
MTMPGQTFLWITEAEVVSMMNMREAMAALEKGLLAEARGVALNMVKTHVEWDSDTLHAIGATFPEAGFAGTKTWTHTKAGATPLLVLFDSNTGVVKAILEAFALGQMRTAGASGVATQWLAATGSDEFAIIGTGKQAMSQVAAVVAVRPIRRIRVFGRSEERRQQFAARVKAEFDIETTAATSARDAVKGATIVTVVTRATDPIIRADMLDRGAHINAVGAIVPSRAEIAADVVARSTQVVVDTIPQAHKLSRELFQFFGPDPARWNSVRSLASLVASRRSRSPDDDLTLFKSLGMGISDLALGIELYKKALNSGLGRELPHPQRVAPRLRTTRPMTSHAGG